LRFGIAAVGTATCVIFALFSSSLHALERTAHETQAVDTEHLFGFTTGSDIGEKGEKEFENETTVHSGKGAGAYTAAFEQLEAKYTVTDSFRVAAAAVFSYHDISNVLDLDDKHQWAFQGAGLDARWRLVDRERSGIGLTLIMQPNWSRTDALTGERAENYGGTTTLAIDATVVPKRVYGAINLYYEPQVTHFLLSGFWVHQSTLGFSGAVTAQIGRGVFFGAEVRSLFLHDGLALDSLAGKALFVGPTFYVDLSARWFISGAWNIQVAGRSSELPGSLDLTHFEHHQAVVRLGCRF
jgi:hypothetical protein